MQTGQTHNDLPDGIGTPWFQFSEGLPRRTRTGTVLRKVPKSGQREYNHKHGSEQDTGMGKLRSLYREDGYREDMPKKRAAREWAARWQVGSGKAAEPGDNCGLTVAAGSARGGSINLKWQLFRVTVV